jgi:hypothetical protein
MDYNIYLTDIKGVTPADKKFIEKCIAPQFHGGRTLCTNHFSGAEIRSNVLIGTLIQFIQELENSEFSFSICSKWQISKGQSVQMFDRARYLVLKIDPHIYSEILD